MIKLKNLIKEAYAWERKFGEPLPTLASVQKKKLKEDLVTEKKELNPKQIQTVGVLTQRNNHNVGMLYVVGPMGSQKFYSSNNDDGSLFLNLAMINGILYIKKVLLDASLLHAKAVIMLKPVSV